jgi:hypothetical protein
MSSFCGWESSRRGLVLVAVISEVTGRICQLAELIKPVKMKKKEGERRPLRLSSFESIFLAYLNISFGIMA